jgi:GTP diphosphokinase / guanosine-3',5'-bis(diphosphate) 3'-diphosphatase
MDVGRELFERRAKKFKFHMNEDELLQHLRPMKIDSLRDFYLKVKSEEIDPDEIIRRIELQTKHPQPESGKSQDSVGMFDRFLTTARNLTGGISLFGTKDNFMHTYAKCCNPIPGDEIIGFVTQGEGIKIHHKSCRNVKIISAAEPQRMLEVSWPTTETGEYAVAIHIAGEDKAGMLNEITHSISTYQNTNIRAVKIDVDGSMFDGTIMINVKNKEHLERVVERLKKIHGVSLAKRMIE